MGSSSGRVSGGDYEAMGLHFVNPARVFDGGELDVKAAPTFLVLRAPAEWTCADCTGVDYLVIAADWDAKHPEAAAAADGTALSSLLPRPPIASGCRCSTRCTCGPGRTTRLDVLELEPRRCPATPSPRRPPRIDATDATHRLDRICNGA